MTSKLEYLKRYEGNESSTKKKKRIKKAANLIILDDDAGWEDSLASEEAHIEDPEDAPVVAQMHDDSVVKWQPLSTVDDISSKRRPDRVFPDSDLSPPRLKISSMSFAYNADLSPPRKSRKNLTLIKHDGNDDVDLTPPRRTKDIDLTPPRRAKDVDLTPPRRKDVNLTPPQRRRGINLTPLKKRKQQGQTIDDDVSLPRLLQKRRYAAEEDSRRQNISTMDSDLSPRSAWNKDKQNSAIGVKRNALNSRGDFDSPADRSKTKSNQTINSDKQFTEWGRGVAQTRGAVEKAIDEEYEMSKPLARYADDEDLDKMLKERTRDGDPMLLFMKKTKDGMKKVAQTRKGKPYYKGDSAPNRFGIRPGYRWDGVDRSNGYEKAWLTQASNKKAVAEESYKWSTEDM